MKKSCMDLLSKCQHRPELGQSKVRSLQLHHIFYVGGRDQILGQSSDCFPSTSAENCLRSRVPGTPVDTLTWHPGIPSSGFVHCPKTSAPNLWLLTPGRLEKSTYI